MNTTQTPAGTARNAAEDVFRFVPSANDAFIGRDVELTWLVDQIRNGAAVALEGPDGMGKSALAERASYLLGRERTNLWSLRFNLGRYERVESFAAAVVCAVSQVRDTHIPGALSDAAFDPTSPTTSGARGISAAANVDLFATLERLNALAQERQQPVVFCVNRIQNLSRFDDGLLARDFARSMQRHRQISYVYCGRSVPSSLVDLSSGRSDRSLQIKQIGAMEAAPLAAWIERKFAGAGIVAAAIGEACVELAGPRTRDIIELARHTFELARKIGVATRRTVEVAMRERVAQNHLFLAATWNTLSIEERLLLFKIASGHERLAPALPAEPHAGLSNPVFGTLAKKGLVDVLPDGRPMVASPTLRLWSLRADVAVNTTQIAKSQGIGASVQFEFSAMRSESNSHRVSIL